MFHSCALKGVWNMGDFDGLGGVVTGAGSGIGQAVAVRLANEGASVLAVDINEESAKETAAKAEGSPGKIVPFRADVTVSSDVKAYVENAVKEFGNLRFFHNNAGVEGVHKSIVDTSEEEWDMVMNINLRSYFLGMKYALPAIKSSGGGAVVITGSILSLKAAPDRSDYVVSKHAVLGLAKTAASECAKDGIKVNCICPGPIEGPLMARSERLVNPDDPGFERKRFEAGAPMGRYGQMEEVADLVAYLLSPRVPYLTGAVVTIDGGIMTV
jgi:NAD(P)-dependent dehydrogenase (short-subunit alcohol dehydrogenase family)